MNHKHPNIPKVPNTPKFRKYFRATLLFATRTRLRKMLSIVLVALILLSSIRVWQFINPGDAAAAWWDDSWGYRQRIDFGNSGASTTNKVVSFPINTASLITSGKMQADCGDIRLTDNNGKLLEHRINTTNGIQFTPGSATEYSSTTTQSSYTFSHIVASGTNQTLVVIVHALDGAAINVTNVTHNGDAMVERVEVDSNDGTYHYVTSIWTRENPDVGGTPNVEVTYDASVDSHVASAMDFTGVDQTTPVGVTASNSSNTVSSLAITGTSVYPNSVLVGGVGRENADTSPSGLVYANAPAKHTYEATSGNAAGELAAGGGFQYAESVGSQTMTMSLSDDTSDAHMNGAFIELKSSTICNSTTTDLEVLFPSIISGNQYAFLYYGNASAPNQESTLTDTAKTLAYKEFTDASAASSSDTHSYTHTVTSGTNQTLVVVVTMTREQLGDYPTDVSTVTYNGDPMVRQVYADKYTENRSNLTEIWTLLNPDTGANTVAITYDQSSNGVKGSAAMTFQHTAQNYLPVASSATSTSPTTLDVTVTTTKANTLLAGGGTRHKSAVSPDATTSDVSVTSPGTEVYDQLQADGDTTSSISMAGGYQSAASIGSQTMNFTSGTATAWTGALVALEPESTIDAFTPTSGPTTAAEEVGPGPVAYYKFDDATGTTPQDSTTHNNDVSVWNSATWLTPDQCVSGNCLRFDGTDDHISAPDSASLSPTTAVSVSVWLRPRDCSATEGASHIIYKNDFAITCSDQSGQFEFTGWVRTDDGNDVARRYVNTNTIFSDANTWTKVDLTYDGGNVNLYINTELGDTTSTSGNIDNTTVNLNIGAATATTYEFNGDIDELKIYPYARTVEQIKTDYIRGAASAGSNAVLGLSSTEFLNQGLVGYWKLEDVNDSSGVGTTLTNNNTATFTTSKFGNGVELNGTTQYLEAIDNASLSITGNLTLSAWIEPDDVSGTQHIVGKWDGTNNSYLLSLENDELRLYVDSASDYHTTTAANIAANTKTHVAGVYNVATQSVTLFVNGTVQAGTTTGTIPASIGDDAGEVVIGADDSPAGYFDGHIDEARVYSRVLTPADIQTLYNWGPSPVAYWPLDENTGTSTVNDKSTRANHATMTGTMTADDWVSGKLGSALDFDGSNDALTIATASDDDLDFAVSQQFSGGAWVYVTTMPGSGNQDAIITKYDETSTLRGYRLVVENDDADATGNFQVEIYDEGADQPLTASGANDTVAANTWYHIYFTFNGGVAGAAGDLAIYTNGILTGSNSANTSFLGLDDVAADFSVGDYDTTDAEGNNTAFTGIIDDVRIYDYIRTSSQIIEDMNGSHPIGGSPVSSMHAHWKFDEANGQTANDSSVLNPINMNLGITTGAEATDPTWTTAGCVAGTCLDFEADTPNYLDDLNGGGANNDIGGESFTISAWIKPETLAADGLILGQDYGNETSYSLGVRSNSNLEFEAYDEANVRQTITNGTAVLTTGEWQHVAVTVANDGSDNLTITFYRNGIQVGETQSSFGIRDSGVVDEIMIGANERTDLTIDRKFDGLIDEVKLYTTALTSDQVKIDYNMGSSTNFGTGTNERTNLTDGDYQSTLVGYWPLDENTGTSTTYDKAGSANGTLTSIAEAAWVPGKYGSSLTLDGAADFIDIGTGPSSVRTISFWTKPVTTTEYFVNLTSTTDYIATSAGTIDMTGDASETIYVNGVPSTTLTAGVWQHITVVTSGAENASNLEIGRQDHAVTPLYLEGTIDDVKIFSSALTQAQIAYEYNRGAPVGWWRFDECQGTTANDASGNGKTGTITIGATGSNTSVGTCNSGTTTQAWNNGTTGKFSSSLDFDGTNDYVDLGSSTLGSLLNGSSAVSIAAWMKIGSYPGAGNDERVVSIPNTGTGLAFTLGPYSNTGQIRTGAKSVSTDSIQTVESIQTFSTGQWIHAVGVIDYPNDTISLYLNGRLDKSSAVTFTNTAYTHGTPSINDFIGQYNNSQEFDGQIDDVRIYNYALSANQVKQVMNGGAVRFE